MDGRRVLKKGGRSVFGLRKKRADYELWVDNEGMEVKQDGARVWGAKPKKA